MDNKGEQNLEVPSPEHALNVDELVSNYKREHYSGNTKKTFLILLVLEILLFAYLIIFSQFNINWLVILLLLPTPWLIEVSYVIKSKSFLMHDFMHQFAQDKNFTYTAEGSIENLKGEIASYYYDTPKCLDIISGTNNQIPFELFIYEYVVRSGRSSKIDTNPIIRLKFTDPLPRLFLQCYKRLFEEDIRGIHFCNGDNPQAHLDGDLDKTFTLWTLQGLQMEGLQIFTAEFTQTLAEKWSDCHVEFLDNYAYIYPCISLQKWSDLERMLDLVQYLTSRLSPRLKEMKSDIEAVESYKNI